MLVSTKPRQAGRMRRRTAQAVQAELVDSSEGVGVLPVVLDDIDVVGGGEQASKGGCFGIPERGGHDAYGRRQQLGRVGQGSHRRHNGPF